MAQGRFVVIIGTQWGDEGKGKIVDLLTEDAAAVDVRNVLAESGHSRMPVTTPDGGQVVGVISIKTLLSRPRLEATDRVRDYMTPALFFEANGLAATGRAPFATLVPQLIEAWIDWVMLFLAGSARERRAEAEAAIAVIDGLILLRLLAGPAAARRAAKRLGVTR